MRSIVEAAKQAYRISERRACELVKLARSTCRYQSTKDGQAALRMRLRDLAATRVHYGYRRLHILLRREGWKVNAKRVYRLYCEEKLGLRTKKPKRRVSCRARSDRPEATRINDCWAMDFMADELFDGRRFRLLTMVGHFTRESRRSPSGNDSAGRMSSGFCSASATAARCPRRSESTTARSSRQRHSTNAPMCME